MQNRQPKKIYPSALENHSSKCKIYYLPLEYNPEPEPEQDWSDKVLQVLERFEVYAMAVCGGLLAVAIVRIVGQHIWGW